MAGVDLKRNNGVSFLAGRFSSIDKELKDMVFCIVGLGLIGGSYAKALRRLGVKKIIAVDSDKDVLAKASAGGIIDVPCFVPDKTLQEADVIIFAVYPAVIRDFVKKNVQYFKSDALLTDAAGIKGNIIEEIDGLLGADMDFVAGHPMAGREGSGFGQSAAEIFDGANYIVVPRRCNNIDNVHWLKKFALALGCKRVAEVSREQHDRIIAYTSNLPHLLAVSLVNSKSMNNDTKCFIAGSFRDASRVADINAELWTDLFLYNRENVLAEIANFQEQLMHWTEALENEDAETLKEMMRSAADKRKALYNG